ncbi:MAG: hypothetical protein ACYCZX_14345 [Rhodospirillaceae bacterium]
MKRILTLAAVSSVAAIVAGMAVQAAAPAAAPAAPQAPMTFFITSVGLGKGADLGGLAGADKHCQALAQAVGAGNHTWHAYLSTQAAGGQPAVNARDRIGAGPWHGAKGGKIADNVAHLHGDTLELARAGNALSKATAFNEKGEAVKATGDTPNQHDILTGSTVEGKAFTDAADHTCKNWTSSTDGTAQLGHFDRTGNSSISWVAAHPSRSCSQPDLIATGGNGLFYCFAAEAR